jgi:hypothetical protein
MTTLNPQGQHFLHVELSRAYMAEGRAQAAIEILERVDHALAEWLDDTHNDKPFVQLQLSRAYVWGGQARKAIELLNIVIPAATATLGRVDPMVAQLKGVLANVSASEQDLPDLPSLSTMVDPPSGTWRQRLRNSGALHLTHWVHQVRRLGRNRRALEDLPPH